MARNEGVDSEWALTSEGHLADAQADAGMCAEALALRRNLMPRLRRVHGDTHVNTLQGWVFLAELILKQGPDGIDEARAIRDAVLPLCTRILGPEHHITKHLAKPDFLTDRDVGRSLGTEAN